MKWNSRREELIKSEIIINLESHKNPSFSESVKKKIIDSGDLNKDFKLELSREDISLTKIRQYMGKKSLDYSTKTINIIYKLINEYIEIGIFIPSTQFVTDKVIYFIHGGGFVGGNFFQYENQLKYLSERTNTSIVAINYRLAPENKYPSGLIDCKIGYDWIVEQSEQFGWNSNNIIFMGDSAGVHLGLKLILEFEEVKFLSMVNLYGCVDLLPESNERYTWSVEQYDIKLEQESLLIARLLKFSQQMKFFVKLYCDEKDIIKNDLFIKNHFNKIPKMLYIEAEFDYFRWSNRFLIENYLSNIEVDVINVKGVDHGFIERLGFCDEALITLDKISDYINNN